MKHIACLQLVLISAVFLGCSKESSFAQTRPDDSETSYPVVESVAVESVVVESEHPFYCDGSDSDLICDLAHAQSDKDRAAVERIATAIAEDLGTNAGVPDRQSTSRQVPPGAEPIRRQHVEQAYRQYLRNISQVAWWTSERGIESLPERFRSSNFVRPRFLAYVISGFVAASEAGAADRDRLLEVARGAADYLVWSQEQFDRGVFPFPDLNSQGIEYSHSEHFRTVATRLGKLDEVLIDGWYVDDLGEGGLQLDNSLAGVALIEFYQATGEEQYLRAALDAADWAMSQPVVPNWNYNSFSIYLLAHAYAATDDPRYLESAKEKARLGIYPGQLQTGPYTGFWADPHNARLNYHYSLIRGLGALVAVMPKTDPDFQQARRTLELALKAGNKKILAEGIVYPELVLETLSELALAFPPSSDRLDDFDRAQTLNLLGRYASNRIRQGQLISPSAWGLYLRTLEASNR